MSSEDGITFMQQEFVDVYHIGLTPHSRANLLEIWAHDLQEWGWPIVDGKVPEAERRSPAKRDPVTGLRLDKSGNHNN